LASSTRSVEGRALCPPFAVLGQLAIAIKPSLAASDRSLMSRVVITLVAVTLGTLGFAATAAATPAEFSGASVDGGRVFFTSSGNLVQGDTDNGFVDVYERFYDGAVGIESLVTREISTGPTGGNDSYNVSFDGVSEDGTYVLFSTAESLVEEDHDHSRDVYQRNTETGETTLLSGGSSNCAPCGDTELPVTFVGAARTGSDVFFTTTEGLVEGDQNGSSDVYMREAGAAAPVLVTPGGSAPATFLGSGPGGTKVVFETSDRLSPTDEDSETDIYERDLSGGTTQLVSLGGTCPGPLTAEECAPVYHATTKGGFVLFETRAQLTGEDHDKSQDVYRWSPTTGTVTLVSTGSEGEEGEGEHDAVFAGTAREGNTVYFETAERLSSSDGDSAPDVYERTGGSTSLISTGNAELPATFNWASADGSAVLFSTEESLQGSDLGKKSDVYERKEASVELVSAGSPEFDSTFAGSSGDGSHVFFVTPQPLDPSDEDTNPDVYEWTEGNAPVWISTGPEGGNGAFTPHLSAVAVDGSHAIFTTREKLTEDDGNGSENDVYDRHGGSTILVSVGNSAQLQLGPPSPSLTGITPASPNASTEPRVLGQAEGGTLIKIYPTADCSGAPAGTGSDSELRNTGIKATVKAGSTTTFHATATNGNGDTSACSAGSVTYVQQSAPPPPPEEEKQEGGGSTGTGGGTTSPGGSGGTGTGSGQPKSGGGTPTVIKIGNVLYVAPLTRITLAPLAKTRVRRPIFQFIDTTEQPNTDFFCRLDRQKWRGCNSPYRPKHRLSLGKHVFAVKGKSFAGQWEQHSVVRGFKVVGR
jgi:hypothetical protein